MFKSIISAALLVLVCLSAMFIFYGSSPVLFIKPKCVGIMQDNRGHLIKVFDNGSVEMLHPISKEWVPMSQLIK